MSDRAPPTGPWTPSDGTDRSRDWDQEEADDFVGLTILAGVTYLAADQKTVKAQAQYYGRIVSADRLEGIEVACEGKWAGTTMRHRLHYERFIPRALANTASFDRRNHRES